MMPRAKRDPITKNGRPQVELDWDLIDDMLKANCHGTSIAAHFKIHPQTFYDRVVLEKGVGFTQYSKQKSSEGDDDLKKVQYEVAKKDKNVTMLIWLGKQRLGQKENHDVVSTPNDQKLDTLLADIKAMREGNIKPPPPSEEIKDPVAE